MKYDSYLKQILPISVLIAHLKLQLSEELTNYVETAPYSDWHLKAKDKEDIEKVIHEAVAKISPSKFNIPLNYRPKSQSGMQKMLDRIDKNTLSSIMEDIVKELSKKRQTKIGEY